MRNKKERGEPATENGPPEQDEINQDIAVSTIKKLVIQPTFFVEKVFRQESFYSWSRLYQRSGLLLRTSKQETLAIVKHLEAEGLVRKSRKGVELMGRGD